MTAILLVLANYGQCGRVPFHDVPTPPLQINYKSTWGEGEAPPAGNEFSHTQARIWSGRTQLCTVWIRLDSHRNSFWAQILNG